MGTELPICLVPFSWEHVDTTYHWLQDRELCNAIDCVRPPTEDENRNYWKRELSDANRKTFAIETVDPKCHIGNCGIRNLDTARRKSELWIYLGIRQREGLGKIACNLLLDFCFSELTLHRIYLRVLETNRTARRFYERLGFVSEGRLRDDTSIDNHPIDSIIFSILDHEFTARFKPG